MWTIYKCFSCYWIIFVFSSEMKNRFPNYNLFTNFNCSEIYSHCLNLLPQKIVFILIYSLTLSILKFIHIAWLLCGIFNSELLAPRHPLFPLLALVFEKCEASTAAPDATTHSFEKELQAFMKHHETFKSSVLGDDEEVNELVTICLWVWLSVLLVLLTFPQLTYEVRVLAIEKLIWQGKLISTVTALCPTETAIWGQG